MIAYLRIVICMTNYRQPIDFVVEVDSLNNISHHHMVTTPQSPVSLLQNSPLYSPVKDSPCSPSSPHSLSVFPHSEDRTSQEDKTSPWSPNDKDEGIELEEGEVYSMLQECIEYHSNMLQVWYASRMHQSGNKYELSFK